MFWYGKVHLPGHTAAFLVYFEKYSRNDFFGDAELDVESVNRSSGSVATVELQRAV